MTDFKQKQLQKERQKALDELLVLECKNSNASIDAVKAILNSGANILYKNSAPLYFACKRQNFPLIKFLIDNGALDECDAARRYISQICDRRFNDKLEPAFFEILDLAHNRTGDFMSLFTPYINNMAVNGRLDKIRALQIRYSLTDAEIVEQIELRVIFEVILNEFTDILQFIEQHKDWISQTAFDRAVDSNEWIVLEYIINKVGFILPSDHAVAKAVFEGHIEVLKMLIACGYSFNKNPLFLERACRAAFTRGTKSLVFLLKNGYDITDTYNNKTILQHAIDEKNINLLGFFETA